MMLLAVPQIQPVLFPIPAPGEQHFIPRQQILRHRMRHPPPDSPEYPDMSPGNTFFNRLNPVSINRRILLQTS